MNYEQKYNEVLERLKTLVNSAKKKGHIIVRTEDIENTFPELKESEDEGARKALIELVKYAKQHSFELLDKPFNVVSMDAMLAWLEKQGESIRIKKGKNYLCTKTHKYAGMEWIEGVKYYSPEDYSLVNQGCTCYCPKYSKEEHNNFFKEVEYDGCLEVDKLEPKFKVKYACGEYNVVDEKDITGVTFYGIEDEPNHIDYVKADTCEIINAKPKFKAGDWIVWQDKCYKVNYNGCGYELVDQNGLSTSLEYGTIDENAHLWTIADANDGDVLTVNGRPFIYCCYDDYQGNYCCIDSNGEFRTTFDFGFNEKTILPATKEQRDTLFAKMKEAGYEWNANKKELKKIETKGGEE